MQCTELFILLNILSIAIVHIWDEINVSVNDIMHGLTDRLSLTLLKTRLNN